MLLAESAEKLLPDWAFFVRCVVNAEDLNPTASREAFHDDEKLEAAREALGGCLRAYLVRLAEQDPDRLQELIALHHLSIKALAVEDDEFFGLFMDWLPFETSLGETTFRELRAKGGPIRYAPTVDQFRQLAHVAAAEGLRVVNAGYTFDRDLLEKYGELHPEATVERVDPAEFVQRFEDLDLDERDRVHDFLRAAEEALRPHGTGAELRKFRPEEIPALYTLDPEAGFRRSVDRAKEEANPLFSSLLDGVAGGRPAEGPDTLLTLNYRNALVRKIAALSDRDLQRLAVEMLYVQALLLGHHPLRTREMTLLNAGMIRLIERSLGGP
jgi:molecular chaperone HtpG